MVLNILKTGAVAAVIGFAFAGASANPAAANPGGYAQGQYDPNAAIAAAPASNPAAPATPYSYGTPPSNDAAAVPSEAPSTANAPRS